MGTVRASTKSRSRLPQLRLQLVEAVGPCWNGPVVEIAAYPSVLEQFIVSCQLGVVLLQGGAGDLVQRLRVGQGLIALLHRLLGRRQARTWSATFSPEKESSSSTDRSARCTPAQLLLAKLQLLDQLPGFRRASGRNSSYRSRVSLRVRTPSAVTSL